MNVDIEEFALLTALGAILLITAVMVGFLVVGLALLIPGPVWIPLGVAPFAVAAAYGTGRLTTRGWS